MRESNYDPTGDADETIISTVELREMSSLSEEITTVLLEHSELSHDQLGPLQHQLDTDALDNLFKPGESGDSPAKAHLQFQFEDWYVDVASNGHFQIQRVGNR